MRICYIDDNVEYLKNFKVEYADLMEAYSWSFRSFPNEYLESDEACDILMLDIEFGDSKNGLDYINSIKEKSPYTQIIVVTAYTEKYIEDIFMKKDNVAGFLKKPVDRDNMLRVLAKAESIIRNKRTEITIKTGKYEYVTVKTDDIRYIESAGHNLRFVTGTNEYVAQGRLDNLSEDLPDSFVRCHKSYFVNLGRIKGFTGEVVIVEDNAEISVSRSKKADFIEAYRNFLQK